MLRSNHSLWSLLCCAVTLSLGSAVARADTLTVLLGTPNSDIAGYAGPYAKVVVDLTSSTTASVTFTSLSSGGNIYLMGDGGSVGLNVNGSFTSSTPIGSNAGTGFDATTYTAD